MPGRGQRRLHYRHPQPQRLSQLLLQRSAYPVYSANHAAVGERLHGRLQIRMRHKSSAAQPHVRKRHLRVWQEQAGKHAALGMWRYYGTEQV